MRFPDDVPTLTDGVVTLRAHRPDDVPALLEQALDPLMVEWTTVPVPSSEETSRAFATEIVPAGWEAGSAWSFAVEALDDGVARFCGTVDLRSEGAGRAELAYGAHPWARGRGLMERACRLLLDWGFTERRLETVIWWAHRGNWASRRLAWRLGFSFDGTVRRWLPHRGALLDGWVGVLLAGDERRPRVPWLEVPRIDGPTVSLRAPGPADVDRVVEACADERTAHWLADLPSPYTREHARAYLAARSELHAVGAGLTWAVVDPSTDVLVALVSLSDLTLGREAEIGYWTHPAERGRGVMTEACRLVTRHAFVPAEDGGLGLPRVTVTAAEGNTASRTVIERTGFTLTGRRRHGSRLRDGSLTDTMTYDMLAEELRL